MLKYLLITLTIIINFNFSYANEINKVIDSLYEKDHVIFKDLKVETTSVESIYKLTLNSNEMIYYNFENDFFMKGDLLKYENKFLNLTKKDKNKANKDLLEEFKNKYEKSFVYYKSNKSPAVMSIYVFTDYTCPYCKKLHQSIKLFQDAGVDIYYIPFPRKSINDYSTVRGLQKIMCSENRDEEFSLAIKDHRSYSKNVVNGDIDCPQAFDILQFNKYADMFKVRGTPTTITDSGVVISGFSTPEEFAYKLRNIMDSN